MTAPLPVAERAWTPGKWGDGNEAICVKIERERPWAGTVFRKNHDGSEANALVAMTFGGSVEEAAANARLIAAAPDLYEACLAAVEWIEGGRIYEQQCCGGGIDCGCRGSTYADEASYYLRDVLAKAKGQTHVRG